jgi:hypothetical protein
MTYHTLKYKDVVIIGLLLVLVALQFRTPENEIIIIDRNEVQDSIKTQIHRVRGDSVTSFDSAIAKFRAGLETE